ncbi:hypothetical protein B0T26DRAFT_651428 [Lasiosphaeria miniovina]|uniref:Uncharacterized protein n=1 Tax=Lasiosphaeria miniovina TaxID=1954250 RepID=A0AA40DS88_9PEZI|nr:uncharacterized protein B0T26DRAFT_651428 [Lasiosphaeria miniovina]KAK0713630.1 hypothetical protein B0T26DRAFT_651428 [Lasiosphaeria miniovina]
MRISIASLPCLAALALALALPTVDYGPCDINGNESCKDIMDNTACFLNPTSTDDIFQCIPGGKVGVCLCYGCLGYTPVTNLIANSSACA